ncbi:hypothetical protein Q7689_31475, partial [Nocardiopsis tropica]|nr:hypothetical protein [Nocardiopsis tropica]
MEENGALREVPPGGVAEQDGPSPGPTASTIRGFPHKGARRTARGNRLGLVLTGLPLVLCGA